MMSGSSATAAAAGNSVTRSLVTPGNAQHGDQIVTECDGTRLVEILNDDGNRGRKRPGPYDEQRFAILPWLQKTARGDSHYVRGFRAQSAERSQVALGAVAVASGNDDLLHGPRSGQSNGVRVHRQRDWLTDDRAWLNVPEFRRMQLERRRESKGEANQLPAAGTPIREHRSHSTCRPLWRRSRLFRLRTLFGARWVGVLG